MLKLHVFINGKQHKMEVIMQFNKICLIILTASSASNYLMGMQTPEEEAINVRNQPSAAAAASTSSQEIRPQRHDIDLYVDKENPNRLSARRYFDETMPLDLVNTLIQDCPDNLKRTVERIKNKERHVARKIILIGPPGCGKSDTAKAIAVYCNMDFTLLHSNELGTSFSNSGIENTKRLFKYAQLLNKPFLIIIDELQDIFDKGANKNSFYESISNIKTHLEEAAKNQNIVIVFTANKLSNVPEAMQSRLRQGVTIIFSKPDFAKRKKILEYWYKNTINNLQESDYAYLAGKTRSLTGRDIYDSVNIAHDKAAIRLKKANQNISNPCLNRNDINAALWCKYMDAWYDTYKDTKETVVGWVPGITKYFFYTGSGVAIGLFLYNKQEKLALFLQNVSLDAMRELAASTQKSAAEVLAVSKESLDIAKYGPSGWAYAKQLGNSAVIGISSALTTFLASQIFGSGVSRGSAESLSQGVIQDAQSAISNL